MNKTIHYAALAGIISLVLDLPLLIFEVLRMMELLSGGFLAAYVVVSVLSAIFSVIFMWGFIVIGKKTKIKLLIHTSYLSIITGIMITGYVLLTAFVPDLDNIIMKILTLVIYGAIGIVFGVALLRLKQRFPLANATGILMIITSASFLTVILSVIGLLTLIPTYILAIMLLFKAAEKF